MDNLTIDSTPVLRALSEIFYECYTAQDLFDIEDDREEFWNKGLDDAQKKD